MYEVDSRARAHLHTHTHAHTHTHIHKHTHTHTHKPDILVNLGLADSVRPILGDGGLDVPDAAQGTMKPHIHIFLSSCLSICLFLSVCRFVCLSDSLSVSLSLTLSLIFVYVFSSLLPSMINHIDPFNQILTIILDFTDNFVRFNVDCDILHPTRPFYNLKTTLDSQKQIFCSK